ncbi:MAG: phage portal protein, partial [Syntrophomonadaceae bacterium]
MFGRPPSNTGAIVNEKTALYSSAVYACVRVISESIASLPLPIYQRLSQGKDRAFDNNLYYILHDQPNPEMTSFTFRELLSSHLLLWGNAYAFIERDNLDRIKGLWPLLPNQTWPERDSISKQIVYKTTVISGQTLTLPAGSVFHIPGMSFDGLVGYSPIRMAREAIGLSLATEEFGARFFGQGTHLGGIVEYDGKLSDEAFERYKKSVNEIYQGLGKSHKLMFLEQGAKYHQVTIPPDDAQFLETRKFQLSEIARIYRVPPHMIGDLERATFSNIEHQSLEFVMHTLRPWLVRWEQAINWKLINPEERKRYFAEFAIDGLLRGDIKSRYDAYAVGRQNGWLSADDIRALENMNPLPDGQGSVYLINGNMIPIGQAGQQSAMEQQARNLIELLYRNEGGLAGKLQAVRNSPQPVELPETRAANVRRGITDSYKLIFADAVARILKREQADIMRQAKKSTLNRAADPFVLWLSDFYKQHEDYIRKIMTPVFNAYARAMQAAAAGEVGGKAGMTADLEQFIKEYQDKFVSRHIGISINQLSEALDQAAAEGQDQLEAL